MYPGHLARILHRVHPPVVEGPGFAGSHVYTLLVTVELDRGMGHHWYVDAEMRAPVVIDVGMLLDGGAGGEPHQPRATDHRAEGGHDLTHIWGAGEVFGGLHRPAEIVV